MHILISKGGGGYSRPSIFLPAEVPRVLMFAEPLLPFLTLSPRQVFVHRIPARRGHLGNVAVEHLLVMVHDSLHTLVLVVGPGYPLGSVLLQVEIHDARHFAYFLDVSLKCGVDWNERRTTQHLHVCSYTLKVLKGLAQAEIIKNR